MGLTDMSCATPRACVAVAETISPPDQVERWNGNRWSIQQTPNALVGHYPNTITLSGVSCASATACTVVGGYNGGSGGPVAERWDGKHWSAQSFLGLPSPRSGLLNDVSCPRPTYCTAVGFGILTSVPGFPVPLVAARWTGHS
jgi:hypothetical protein